MHFADVYGASVSKDTGSRITDMVLEEMVEWANRPLDRVYPVIFIDAIVVRVRDGADQTGRQPAGLCGDRRHRAHDRNEERDILALWAGDGGEGAKFWPSLLTGIKTRGVEDVCILVCADQGRTQGPARLGRERVAADHRADVRHPPTA